MTATTTSRLLMLSISKRLRYFRLPYFSNSKNLFPSINYQSTINCTGQRLFSSTQYQLASKFPTAKSSGVSRLSKAIPHSHTGSSATAKLTIGYASFINSFASRASPTLLFQAPSFFLYTSYCWILGGFCFTWCGYNFYWTYLHPLPGTDHWILVGTSGVCILMACFGIWFTLGAFRIVHSITAIPTPPGSKAPLRLRLNATSIFPGIKARVIEVPHSDITVSGFLFRPLVKLSTEERLELRIEDRRKHEVAKTQILTLPFRQASYWIWRGIKELKDVLWKDRFIFLHVKGRNGVWKLDKTPAWVLDEGRALDRLVKHRIGI